MILEVLGKFTEQRAAGFTLLEWIGIAALLVLVGACVAAFLFRLVFASHRFRPRQALIRAASRSQRSGNGPKAKEKILIVDDEPATLQANARLLTTLGYQVVTAGSGEEAVRYMRGNGADLVLLDIIMNEGIDGVETFRQIREIRRLQKAVILSGYAEPSKVAAMRGMGVQHYLIKPVALGVLAQAVRDELDSP